jgi:predicted GH43/DUF377 family glycosyl hydrolase
MEKPMNTWLRAASTISLAWGAVAICTACGEEPSDPPKDDEPEICDARTGWTRRDEPLFRYAADRLDGAPGDPTVVRTDDGYVMFYGAARGDFSDGTVRIFRATSTDGVSWQRDGVPVLEPTSGDAFDNYKVETPNVLKRPDGTWAMYYSGNINDPSELGFGIGLATSPDGETWTRVAATPVLAPNSDELSLIGPSVLLEDDGSYLMLYASITPLETIQIYRATSTDGVSWSREGAVLSMDDIDRVSPDDYGVMGPELVKTDAGYEMVYNPLLRDGETAPAKAIFYARSPDGRTFTKHPTPLHVTTSGDAFDATEVGAQAWMRDGDRYRIWYLGTNTDYVTSYDSGMGLLELACP